VYFVD